MHKGVVGWAWTTERSEAQFQVVEISSNPKNMHIEVSRRLGKSRNLRTPILSQEPLRCLHCFLHVLRN